MQKFACHNDLGGQATRATSQAMPSTTDPRADVASSPPSDAADVAISIIVPCWREDAVPLSLAARWLQSRGVCEVLVAAGGGGNAGQRRLAWTANDPLHPSRTGKPDERGGARGDGNVLLFHHADTELLEAHLHSLHTAMSADATLGGGAFRRQFDERHPHLRWLEPWEALRCRRFGPLFGDQSVFVRRSVFETLGGYGDMPLMEDVELTCRMRRYAPIVLLGPGIRSSARKHIQQGSWRTTGTNALFLLLYICGVSPLRLHAWYYRHATATD